MGKPPTGESCAEEPHARFGGRGGSFSLSDTYIEIDIDTNQKKKAEVLAPASSLFIMPLRLLMAIRIRKGKPHLFGRSFRKQVITFSFF